MSFMWKQAVLPAALLFVILVIAAVGVSYYSAVETKYINVQARDWQSISFLTELDGRSTKASHYAAKNVAGGGIIGGQTQFISTYATDFPDEPPYVSGISTFTADEVLITLFDISDWINVIDFDSSTGSYRLLLGKSRDSASYEPSFHFAPPFDYLSTPLVDRILYQSTQPETLTLALPDDRYSSPYISLGILSDEPIFWGWDLRRGCQVELLRSLDLISSFEIEVIVSEQCPQNRDFQSLDDRRQDSEAGLSLFFESLVLVPSVYGIHSDGLGHIVDSGEGRYLILIQKSDGAGWFAASPQDLKLRCSVYPVSSALNSEVSLLKIAPTTREIILEGPSGKVSAGLRTVSTDELSRVMIHYAEWPLLTVDNQFAIQEDGTQKTLQILSTKNQQASGLMINGEQILQSRWNELAPDIRGAVIGACIAAVFTTIGWALSLTILRRYHQSLTPTVQVMPEIPVPTIRFEPHIIVSERKSYVVTAIRYATTWLYQQIRKIMG